MSVDPFLFAFIGFGAGWLAALWGFALATRMPWVKVKCCQKEKP